MAKIYLSATYQDLKPHRDAVYRILRMLRHDVISMEDYVAADTYPLHKCLSDVAACDVYLGLIGWRYGYIPDRDNPENRSITALEYRQAGASGLPQLMFLADAAVPWPDEFKDSYTGEGDNGRRIAELRAELENDQLVSHFRTPEHLAGLVSVAVQHCLVAGNAANGPATGSIREVKHRTLQGRPVAWMKRSDAEGKSLSLLRSRLIGKKRVGSRMPAQRNPGSLRRRGTPGLRRTSPVAEASMPHTTDGASPRQRFFSCPSPSRLHFLQHCQYCPVVWM